MYTSIKVGQIQKAVKYFLRDAPEGDHQKAKKCLDLVKFGMANTLVTYEDQNWIYGGNLPVKDKGLTIGAFESTLFSNLLAAYLLENPSQLFEDSRYTGIHRDDGINIINQKRSTKQMVD